VLLDAHVHLSDPELLEAEGIILPACVKANIACACVSADPSTSAESLKLGQRWPGTVFPFIGLHPWEVDEGRLRATLELLEDPGLAISGVGEIGLDGRAMKEKGREAVLRAFELQLRVAERKGLPVSVHCRDAVAETLEVLSTFSLRRVLLHWFTGEAGQLSQAMQRGWYVSVGPSLLYSKRSAEVAASADRELLLIESDGPVRYGDLLEGRPATPLILPSVLLKLSQLWGMRPEDVEVQLERNGRLYLGIT